MSSKEELARLAEIDERLHSLAREMGELERERDGISEHRRARKLDAFALMYGLRIGDHLALTNAFVDEVAPKASQGMLRKIMRQPYVRLADIPFHAIADWEIPSKVLVTLPGIVRDFQISGQLAQSMRAAFLEREAEDGDDD